MKKRKIEIFQDERFIGRLLVEDSWMGIIVPTEEELKAEVERRLPTLKGKNYIIRFI